MSFKIDDAATLGSILNALKMEGVKTGDIAKVIDGISEKPLRRALKEAGYVFQNKAPKGWIYIGEGEEPLNHSVFDYVKRNSPAVHTQFTHSNTEVTSTIEGEQVFTQDHTRITKGETNVNSPVIHPQFTQDETRMILEMLQEWKQQKQLEITSNNNEPVHERIKVLSGGDKVRKTIVIDKTIGDRLDEYCKSEKLNKSDIIHLALIDFFHKNS